MKMRFCDRWKTHAISSRGAVVVLVWGTLVHQMTDYSVGYLVLGIYGPPEFIRYLFIALPCAQLVGFLMYPLAGVLADTWSRLGTMLAGLCIQTVATVVVSAIVMAMQFAEEVRELWYVWAILICSFGFIRVGLAVYEPNAMQMGSIQMPEASSSQLSAYVHWFFWTLLFGQGWIDVLLIILTAFLDFTTAAQYTILYSCIAQLVSIPIVFVLAWTHRKLLSIRLMQINPLKQLRHVLRYAAEHKYPKQRSAFTYGEMPSRLDLAKTRYGGPYTTEQVEDVKTFFRIILVLVSLLGFRFQDQTGLTSSHIRVVVQHEQALKYGFNFVTIQIFGMSIFVIFTGIPIYQLIIKPLFHRFLTTMLKRIFIGLILQLTCLCILQVLEAIMANYIETIYSVDACSYYENFTLQSSIRQNVTLPFPYQLVILPQLLTGLTFLLIFLTVFEFILAQSPHNMQGLLIGIWYAAYAVNLSIGALEQVGCLVWITGIKAVLTLIFTIVYAITALKYQRRLRDEPTEHNQHQVVEDIYERYLLQDNKIINEQLHGSMVVMTATK